jgi:DNA-binding NarL/FixJ family response regulator
LHTRSISRLIAGAAMMTSEQLLDLLDRIYDPDSVELDWLRGIGEAVRPLVDCGAGVTVHRMILPPHPTAGGDIAIVGLGNDARAMWNQLARVVPIDIVSDLARTPISNAARCATPRVRRYAAIGHAAMGVASHSGINAPDLEHSVVSIGVPSPVGGPVFWPERHREHWERIAAHLGAALRMRRAGAGRAAPALIADQRGRTQHVAPGVAADDLAPLREAVAGVARARRVRMSPEAMLGAWRALYAGRWSIVESTERDGRRLLVARPDAPLPGADPPAWTATATHPPGRQRPLSAQERRALIALGNGHSNKLIAYEMGLATSTVGTLLARAARKLGCRDRVTLARTGRDLADPLPAACAGEAR